MEFRAASSLTRRVLRRLGRQLHSASVLPEPIWPPRSAAAPACAGAGTIGSQRDAISSRQCEAEAHREGGIADRAWSANDPITRHLQSLLPWKNVADREAAFVADGKLSAREVQQRYYQGQFLQFAGEALDVSSAAAVASSLVIGKGLSSAIGQICNRGVLSCPSLDSDGEHAGIAPLELDSVKRKRKKKMNKHKQRKLRRRDRHRT